MSISRRNFSARINTNRSRASRFLREACRRVRAGLAAPAALPASMGLENLENRQMLSISAVGTYNAGMSAIPVANNDLLQNPGTTMTGTTYAQEFEGGPITNLTDGKTAVDPANTNEASATGNAVFNPAAQWTVTYKLPVNANGWTITGIDSITGHGDARTNQHFEVSVLTKNGFWPTPLSPDNQGFKYLPGKGGSAKLSITDTRGLIVSGVTEITFQALGNDPSGPVTGGVWRELDVFGVPTTLPAVPTGVTAKGYANPQGVKVKWTASAQAESYDVYRTDTTPGGAYFKVNLTPVTDTFYVDQDWMLQPGTTYYYKVVAHNAAGDSAQSTASGAVTLGNNTADAPTNIKAVGGLNRVNLSWTEDIFATGYDIYRSTNATSGFAKVNGSTPVTGATYTDTNNVLNGTTYYYKIASVNGAGAGAQSAAVSAVTAMIGTGTGLVGNYYNTRDLTGAIVLTRPHDAALTDVNNYGDLSPQSGTINNDNYSIRWEGLVQAPATDVYTFYTRSDDGIRLWIDDQLINDHWVDRGPNALPGDIPTAFIPMDVGSKHKIRVEFYENGGGALAELRWSSDGDNTVRFIPKTQLYQPAPATPTVTVNAGDKLVRLNWGASNFATGYTILRGTTSGQLAPIATGVTATTYDDTTVTNGTKYYYQVAATNDDNSSPSAEVSATPQVSPPVAPVATAQAGGNGAALLKWNAIEFVTGYTIKRSSTAGGPYTIVASNVTGTSYRDTGLTAGNTYYYVVSATNAAGEGPNSTEVNAVVSNLPAPWLEEDIGTPLPGSSSYDAATGTYTIVADGADIWDGGDHFHYVYQKLHGEFTITARVLEAVNLDGSTVNGWLKVGLMARDTTYFQSPHVSAAITGDAGAAHQARATIDGGGTNVQFGAPNQQGKAYTKIQAPYWVRLTREGNAFTSFYSPDGVTWYRMGLTTLTNAGQDILAGLYLTSHDGAKLSQAKFDNVSITQAATVAAPTNVFARITDMDFVMTWARDSFAQKYEIQRSTDPNFTPGTIENFTAGATATSFTNRMPVREKTYYYRIRTISSDAQRPAASEWKVISANPSTFQLDGGDAYVVGHYYQSRSTTDQGSMDDNLESVSPFPRATRLELGGIFNDFGSGAPTSVRADYYTMAWTGSITAPVSGMYTFISRSDDGGYAWVNGQLVSANPGWHGFQDPDPLVRAGDRLIPIQLEAGQKYDLAAVAFEGGGGAGLTLEWVTPDGYRSRIPGNFFSPKDSAPVAPSDLAFVQMQDGKVKLSFTDNSVNELAWIVERATDAAFTNPFQIRHGGNLGVSAYAAEGAIPTITVFDEGVLPNTTYFYRVRAVGSTLTSDPSNSVEVNTNANTTFFGTGLSGHYYDQSGYGPYGWGDVNEPFMHISGLVKNQLDAQVDFADATWDPRPTQVEAASARWTGKIYIPSDGTYTFAANGDDATYVIVDGQPVAWWPGGHGGDDTSGSRRNLNLTTGWHSILMATGEGNGGRASHLRWFPAGGTQFDLVPSSNLDPNMDAPAKPSAISTGLVYSRGATINWTRAANNDLWQQVQRSTDADFGNPANIVTLAQLPVDYFRTDGAIPGTSFSYTDNTVKANTTYYYRVASVNYGGAGISDVIQAAVPAETIPAAPTNLMAGSNISTDVTLVGNVIFWTDASLNEDMFAIERQDPGSSTWTEIARVPTNTVQYQDMNVTVGQTYKYRVRAMNALGNSAWSNEASTTTTATPIVGAGVGLIGRYYNTEATFLGDPAMVRQDKTVDFYFEQKAQQPPQWNRNNDAAVWTGLIQAPVTGVYTFFTASDDGSRIYLNNSETENVNNWFYQGRGNPLAGTPVFLVAGQKYPIRIEFMQGGGGTNVTAWWQATGSGLAQQVLPTAFLYLPDTTVVPSALTGLTVEALSGRNILRFNNKTTNATEVRVYRATAENGPFTLISTITNPNQTIYADNSALAAGTYYYKVVAANAAGEGAPTSTVSVTAVPSNLPAGWQQTDLRYLGWDPALPGDVAYNAGTGEYTIRASGMDIWNTDDAGHFVYQVVPNTDMEMTMRVASQEVTDVWAKIGLMIRQSLAANDVRAFMATAPASGTTAARAEFTGRLSQGALASHLPEAAPGSAVDTTQPIWLKLIKKGNLITGQYSTDGFSWQNVGEPSVIPFTGDTLYVGVASTSHVRDRINTSTFDNWTITQAVANTTPAPAQNVVVTPGAGNKVITIKWDDMSDNETGFKVQRATSAGGPFTDIATVGPSVNVYSDTGLNAGTYYYRVVATNSRAAVKDAAPAAGNAPASPSTTPDINITEFANSNGWQLNGTGTGADGQPWLARLVTNADNKKVLRLTETTNSLAGSAFLTDKRDITKFTATFDFQSNTSNVSADGFLFVLQNAANGASALGGGGGALGFVGLGAPAVGIKFDSYPSNVQTASTGLYVNNQGINDDGDWNVLDQSNSVNMRSSGINFRTGHAFRATFTYDGTYLYQKVVDLQDPAGVFNWKYEVDLPQLLGGPTAYVGFTGATGGENQNSDILNFSFKNVATLAQPLVITGTANADTAYIKRDGDNYKVWLNATGTGNPALTAAVAEVSSIVVNGLAGDDYIVLDLSGGAIQPEGGITLNGDAGADVVNIRGIAATADVTVSNTQVIAGAATINYNDATVEFGLRNAEIGASPAVTEFKSLSLTGTAKAQLAAAGVNATGDTKDQVLVLSGLTIASGAQLDVQDTSIIIKNVSDSAAKAQELMGKIASGRTGGTGAWDGPGIISSNAKADELALTTVGALDNNSEGAAFIENYYGVPVGANSVIVKYTYFGDTNLDGEISGSDYAVADIAFWLALPNPGWKNGDNNGDGVVDGSDYATMDVAFWLQNPGKPLGSDLFDEPIVADAAAGPFAQAAAPKADDAGSFLTDDIAVLA